MFKTSELCSTFRMYNLFFLFFFHSFFLTISYPSRSIHSLASSCARIMMPPLSEEQFLSAVKAVVRDNIAYVPPYGSNGALYLRPLLFGSGPRIGLQPADEYTFLLMVIPVGTLHLGLVWSWFWCSDMFSAMPVANVKPTNTRYCSSRNTSHR